MDVNVTPIEIETKTRHGTVAGRNQQLGVDDH